MNYKEIKPIPTLYNGINFRSRAEARWAVFFEKLGVKYAYEPKGYKLRFGSMYLPDFYVEGFSSSIKSAFFEVKPDADVEGVWQDKSEFLSELTGERVYLLSGAPDFRSYLFYDRIDQLDLLNEDRAWHKVTFDIKDHTWYADKEELLPDFQLQDLNDIERTELLKTLFSPKYAAAVQASRTAKFG